MSDLLKALGGASSALQIGGSALSLVGAAKAFVSSKNEPDITSGFLFDIPQTERIRLAAQITDHFTEDNEAIQDHVAFDPIKLTLTGMVGELLYEKSAIEKYATMLFMTMGSIGAISPNKSLSALRFLSEAARLKSAANSVMASMRDIGALFDAGKYGKNRQQESFSKLQKLFYSRQVVKIETPWINLPSMILESIELSQEEDSKDRSYVTCSFKEIRVIGTAIGYGVPITNRNEAAKQPVKVKGAAPKDESVLSAGTGIGEYATGGK